MSLPAPHRFSVEEYHRMGHAGVFQPNARLELIGGEIVEMAPIGSNHASVVTRFGRLLERACGEHLVRVQNPITLSREDEPQPDLALVRAEPTFYRGAHPRPDDVLLVIEVADTTLAYDRDEKLPRFAAAGIPEVWIVDLHGDRFHVFRRPRHGAYEEEAVVSRGERVHPLALSGLAVGPEDLGERA